MVPPLLRRTPLGRAVACAGLLLAPSLRAQEYGPWHVVGPFDAPEGASQVGLPTPVERSLKAMEAGAEGPDLRSTYKGKGGHAIAWVPLACDEPGALDVGAIDFAKALPAPPGVERLTDRATAYLYRRVEAGEDLDVPVAAGSDDAMRLWLDGELLVERAFARKLALQDHELRLRLKRGANHLLVKVTNEGGPWTFRIAPWKRIAQERINGAIDRGVRWLLSRQLLDGTWGAFEEWGAGHPAFSAYALLACGLRPDHPAVEMAIRAAEEREIETTYAASCLILALERLRDPAREPLFRRTFEDLLSWQDSTGLYGYPVFPKADQRPSDLSNTLFAALALRAAARAGHAVPDDVWLDLASGALRCIDRNPSGPAVTGGARPAGFSYRVAEGGPTGSTTMAGISVLAIAEEGLKGRLPGPLRSRVDPAKAGALAWIEKNMHWTGNPLAGAGHHYWFIYGFERVGALLGRERLGGLDWYWNGADYLVNAQSGEGSWTAEGGNSALETLLALLFLKRATAPATGKESEGETWATAEPDAELRLRARGQSPTTIWIEAVREDLAASCSERGRGISVEKVEFWGRLGGGEGEAVRLSELPGAIVSPEGVRRFEVRLFFPRRGDWSVWARAFVRPPIEKDAQESTRILLAPPLVIPIREVLEPERLAYAGDFKKNLLRGLGARAEASTSASAAQKPEMALDGSMGTAWFCAATDGSPWIRIALPQPVRASRVLLSHGRPREESARGPRVRRAEVLVNGEKRFEVDANLDVLLKTICTFPKPLPVQRLEVRILAAADGRMGGSELGFSEIELQAGP
ncbi:MAG TPA: hypothetical protein VFI25_02720 [Planctomycetota bacterium]|jgi:hypothetical protein|nr:hypothetical protein [Planctomycetota bacterium]